MPGFSPDSGRRIAQTTRRTEQTPFSRVPAPSPPRISVTAKYAIVTTAIMAANPGAMTLGKGAGKLQSIAYDASDNATYSDSGDTIPIYSGATATGGAPIPIGQLVIVEFMEGRYHVIVDFC